MHPIIETLRHDCDYRCNEDQTETMTDDERWHYLRAEAQKMDGQDELECVYDIYREIVWRFPDQAEAWREFAQVANRMGFSEEAQAAEYYATELS
jgi:hypothetical protein